MCRLAAYVGSEAVAASTLLYDMPMSLERMAYAPQELLTGHVAVDGTGVAWWPPGSDAPLRYISDKTPWSDPNLPLLAPTFRGSPVIGAVRSATEGISYGPDNVAPFITGDLAGAHNGWIGGFCGAVGRGLLGKLSDERFGRLSAMNDSLALILLVDQYREDGVGEDLAETVSAVIADVAEIVIAAGEAATLNLIAAAGGEMVAARASAATEVNSLYLKSAPSGSWIASEPMDNSAEWRPQPPHSVALITADGIEVRELSGGRRAR